jgi:hypothetical protein
MQGLLLRGGDIPVGPLPIRELSGLRKVLCTKGTASAVPHRALTDEGFNPWGTSFSILKIP